MFRGDASGERGKGWGVGDDTHVTCSVLLLCQTNTFVYKPGIAHKLLINVHNPVSLQ